MQTLRHELNFHRPKTFTLENRDMTVDIDRINTVGGNFVFCLCSSYIPFFIDNKAQTLKKQSSRINRPT